MEKPQDGLINRVNGRAEKWGFRGGSQERNGYLAACAGRALRPLAPRAHAPDFHSTVARWTARPDRTRRRPDRRLRMRLARPLRHVTLATALLASVGSSLSPMPLGAQASGQGQQRLPRRYVFGAFGALVAGVVSAKFFAPGSAPGKRSCSACVISLAALGGGLGGYFFGRQLDQLYMLRFRNGAPLTPRTLSVQLAAEPSLLAAADSVVAVAGVGG